MKCGAHHDAVLVDRLAGDERRQLHHETIAGVEGASVITSPKAQLSNISINSGSVTFNVEW